MSSGSDIILVADGSSGNVEKGDNYSGVYMPCHIVMHALKVSIRYAIALVILLIKTADFQQKIVYVISCIGIFLHNMAGDIL